MFKTWINKTCSVSDDCGTDLHPLVRTILATRGMDTAEAVRSYLTPSLSGMLDPHLLKGIEKGVARLLSARTRGERICIYGDYDVDGITGTALLVSFMRLTGFSCHYFIPNRFDDGYGLNQEAIAQIADSGATLIVSVDCGITAVEEAQFCRQLGVDLIIVDHHAPRPELPDALAVINPLQPGCAYPYKSLAGAGVAFNLLIALRSALRSAGAFRSTAEPDLRQWLDLVALGTIADVVPLTGQNRIYVHHGLKLLEAPFRTGLTALKQVCGIAGGVSCGQVGFRLAPRLNAAGRLESAVPGVELLLSHDQAGTLAIANELDAANAERQAIEKRIFEEAVAMIEQAGCYPGQRSIVLASPDWHQGVVGIVASRLVERYHRPTILIALDGDLGKGSGRSIPGLHLLEALAPCGVHLERYGGHRYAAGVGMRADRVALFAEAFEASAASLLSESDLVPRLEIDAEALPGEITRELVAALKLLEPFGAGNAEPVLMMRNLQVVEQRIVGQHHLRLRLTREGHTFSAIAFRMADREVADTIDIAFYPELNQWKSSSQLQLRIKDLRPAVSRAA